VLIKHHEAAHLALVKGFPAGVLAGSAAAAHLVSNERAAALAVHAIRVGLDRSRAPIVDEAKEPPVSDCRRYAPTRNHSSANCGRSSVIFHQLHFDAVKKWAPGLTFSGSLTVPARTRTTSETESLLLRIGEPQRRQKARL
jgi:hypothetical protein